MTESVRIGGVEDLPAPRCDEAAPHLSGDAAAWMVRSPAGVRLLCEAHGKALLRAGAGPGAVLWRLNALEALDELSARLNGLV